MERETVGAAPETRSRAWRTTRLINPLVLRVLRWRLHPVLSGSLIVLGYVGRKSGRYRELPVMYACAGGDLVVVAGDAEGKTWWRNFGPTPRLVTIWVGGARLNARAWLPPAGSVPYLRARRVYLARFPQARVPDGAPVLLITPGRPGR